MALATGQAAALTRRSPCLPGHPPMRWALTGAITKTARPILNTARGVTWPATYYEAMGNRPLRKPCARDIARTAGNIDAKIKYGLPAKGYDQARKQPRMCLLATAAGYSCAPSGARGAICPPVAAKRNELCAVISRDFRAAARRRH